MKRLLPDAAMEARDGCACAGCGGGSKPAGAPLCRLCLLFCPAEIQQALWSASDATFPRVLQTALDWLEPGEVAA